MTTLAYPAPRFAVLLTRVVHTDEADGYETIEYEWHYNHRMYLSAPTAKSMPLHGGTGGKRVIKIDPAICEPDGMDPQAEYEFCEQMVEHWAKRAMAARAAAEGGVDTAESNPRKRTRKKKKSAAPPTPKLSSLAKQALVMGAAAAIGTVLANTLTKSNETPITAPAKQPGLLDVLLLPKGPSDGG